jgi:DNA repair protein RadC
MEVVNEAVAVVEPVAPLVEIRREGKSKPRARIFDIGPARMDDADLLGVLLGSGGAAQSARQTADELLLRFDGLGGIGRADVTDLRDERGVGPARAAVVAAAFELGRRSLSPHADRPRLRYAVDVDAHYRPKLAHLRNEVFHVACLDVRNRLIRDVRISEGGFSACAVFPREAFAPAMREGAVGVIFVHNHPSGETDPSPQDLGLTQRLVQAGQVLGVRVLDHVIIGATGHASMRAMGIITCAP